jgi:hypothetical protein
MKAESLHQGSGDAIDKGDTVPINLSEPCFRERIGFPNAEKSMIGFTSPPFIDPFTTDYLRALRAWFRDDNVETAILRADNHRLLDVGEIEFHEKIPLPENVGGDRFLIQIALEVGTN